MYSTKGGVVPFKGLDYHSQQENMTTLSAWAWICVGHRIAIAASPAHTVTSFGLTKSTPDWMND